MSNSSRRALYWAPRALSILYILFLSMFALDVFGEGRGFWQTLVALAMHLIPSFVLIVALVLAWRWEWIGTAFYAGAAALYLVWLLLRPSPPPAMKLLWFATIAGPALLAAALFFANWLKRQELHARA